MMYKFDQQFGFVPEIRCGFEGGAADQLVQRRIDGDLDFYAVHAGVMLFHQEKAPSGSVCVEDMHAPGVVQVSLRAAIEKRENTGLLQFTIDQYGER